MHINVDQSVQSEPRMRLQLAENLLRETQSLLHRLEVVTTRILCYAIIMICYTSIFSAELSKKVSMFVCRVSPVMSHLEPSRRRLSPPLHPLPLQLSLKEQHSLWTTPLLLHSLPPPPRQRDHPTPGPSKCSGGNSVA